MNKYGRWRSTVQKLLTLHWQQPSSIEVEGVAATVVGMFDAGASDREVAAFLRSQELLERQEALLTDEARMTLVQQLHRSAGAESSEGAPAEEL
jgi:hypothetical protein